VLSKLYKLMKKTETNQSLKGKYVDILNAKINEESHNVCDVEKTIKDSISNLLNDACLSTRGLSEFCQEVRMYQQAKFVPEEFHQYYYEEKASAIIRSFANDVNSKLQESLVCPINKSAK
jgi:hypothetical protein